MATALFSFKLNDGGKITVAHIFFGQTDAEAAAALKGHAAICPQYGPAHRAGETVEIPVEVSELPPDGGDEEELGAWLDDVMSLDDEEEDEEDDADGDDD
jgi:hypothetical protein